MLTYGTDADGIEPPKKRERIGFHPAVEALIQKGKFSHQVVNKWRERGVPYRICNHAYALALESGLLAEGNVADVQMLRRPVHKATEAA